MNILAKQLDGDERVHFYVGKMLFFLQITTVLLLLGQQTKRRGFRWDSIGATYSKSISPTATKSTASRQGLPLSPPIQVLSRELPQTGSLKQSPQPPTSPSVSLILPSLRALRRKTSCLEETCLQDKHTTASTAHWLDERESCSACLSP